MEKIFSFSLYGNKQIYIEGAINNAKQIPKIFGNDWIIRFYIKDVKVEIIDKLKSLKCEIIDMTNSYIKNGMFFRFLSIKKNNIVMIRDCDSCVSYREKMMVNDFLNSKKKLHIIRDHPNHKEHIIGCSFGFNNSDINMEEIIKSTELKNVDQYNIDQLFLAKFIYPLYKNNMLIHDNFNNFYREKDELIIKYPRKIYHVGCRIYNPEKNITEDMIRLNEFNNYIKFSKNNFKSMYELIEYFLHYLSISRMMKRIYIFNEFYINDELVLLDDYILMKELNRYTYISRKNDITNEILISSEINDKKIIKLSELLKIDNINNKELINIDIEILNDLDYDSFSLYNVLQLNDEINYQIEEYLVKKNIDKYNTIIVNEEKSIDNPSIIKYNDIFNDFTNDKNTNDLIKLFSGMFRIHISPNKLVINFSKRYWHHWDEEFKFM
jgi:hypothetical protein